MAIVRSYGDLIAWQKAMVLTKDIYKHTSNFPKEEMYGLTSQMRRSAISVPSNIAEGQARNTTGEFKQHLGIARGSLAELETQILLARSLGFMTDEDCSLILPRSAEVNKLINGLLRSLN